jgi:hypothetical protein
MRAILEIGYKGYVGQEFIPKRKDKYDKVDELIGVFGNKVKRDPCTKGNHLLNFCAGLWVYKKKFVKIKNILFIFFILLKYNEVV